MQRTPFRPNSPLRLLLMPWCRLWIVTVVLTFVSGCDQLFTTESLRPSPRPVSALAALASSVNSAIIVQGRLEPAGGVLAILVAPGDRIAEINVAEGDTVTQDQTLAVLQSLSVRKTELVVAQTQLREARQRAVAELAVAKAKLEVADIQLQQAELELTQARSRFDRAKSSGGELDLLQQQVALAENRLNQIRMAFNDRSTSALVSQSSLDQQELAVNQARSAAQAARVDAEQSIARGELLVETARRELSASKLVIASSEASSSLDSLEQQIELLKLQVDAAQVLSPIAATVLQIDATPGQATTIMPLMQIADTSRMICRAEVDVAEIRKFAIGAEARISSPALAKPISGRVRNVSRMMGSPQLQNPSPMARVDWRATEVIIEIDAKDNEAAARFINLQVDVAIETSKPQATDSKTSPAMPSQP